MKTILVPTDFSGLADNAARYATDMARAIQADIILVHVLPLPVTVWDVPVPLGADADAFKEAEATLSRFRDVLQAYSDNQVNIIAQVHTGAFEDQMQNLAADKQPFAVVMGTKGAGATEAFFLGSYTRSTIKALHCPVIVVPAGFHFKSTANIGLACDMKNVAETMPFRSIRDIAEVFGARLKVLYVSKPGEQMYPKVLQESGFIQNNLDHLHPELRITTHENIIEGINEFIRKDAIDLLLVMPRERGFLEGLFHTSVTQNMIRNPEAPVMVIHS